MQARTSEHNNKQVVLRLTKETGMSYTALTLKRFLVYLLRAVHGFFLYSRRAYLLKYLCAFVFVCVHMC